MKIAVSGKGGVGKTTISANLAKLFRNEGFNVYAVDADPDSSLGLALGMDEKELSGIRPVIEMSDVIGETAGDGALYTLNPAVDSIIDKYSIQFNGIRFLRMGGIKQGGSSCYCRENTFLKALVNALILDTRDVVIMDMGAGIEHLTRGTSGGVDLMVIVTEPGRSSVHTARIVEGLARDIGIKEIRFIANKVRNIKEKQFIQQHFKPEELMGILSYDEAVAEKSMGYGQNPMDIDNEELKQILSKITSRIQK